MFNQGRVNLSQLFQATATVLGVSRANRVYCLSGNPESYYPTLPSGGTVFIGPWDNVLVVGVKWTDDYGVYARLGYSYTNTPEFSFGNLYGTHTWVHYKW